MQEKNTFFELPDGREYIINAYQYPGRFEISFGGHNYVEEYADAKEASSEENFRHLNEKIIMILLDFSVGFTKISRIIDELKLFASCMFDFNMF